ncbi:MAG: XdhC family protein [Planctomycetes bacterium]|nr:XdhC family protein [Planctomycetota bacterium]
MSSQDIKEAIEQLTASGKAYVVATVVRTEAPSSAKAGDRAVLDEEGILAGWVGGGCAKPAVTRNAVDALRDGQTRLIRISRNLEGLESGIMGYPMTCQSGGTLDIFIEPIMPKPLLVVIGQTAIAQALCALAAGAGYDVVVAAPGGKRERFPTASDWIEDLDDVAKIERTASAIVVATQGSGDALGLDAALTLGAAYIGLIASPKKSARLKETLKKRGFDANAVDSIDAPAGLDIGAVTAEEIAVSVLAELVQRRRCSNAENNQAGEHAGTC